MFNISTWKDFLIKIQNLRLSAVFVIILLLLSNSQTKTVKAQIQNILTPEVYWKIPFDYQGDKPFGEVFANTSWGFIFVVKGELNSVSIKTKKLNWKVGKNLLPYFVIKNEIIFCITKENNINAISLKTKKIIWKSKENQKIANVQDFNKNVIVSFQKISENNGGSGFFAANYDYNSGKRKWIKKYEGFELSERIPHGFYGTTLIWEIGLNGLLGGYNTLATDLESGNILWKQKGKPVYFNQNDVWIANFDSRYISGNYPIDIQKINLATKNKIAYAFNVEEPKNIATTGNSSGSFSDIFGNEKYIWVLLNQDGTGVIEKRNLLEKNENFFRYEIKDYKNLIFSRKNRQIIIADPVAEEILLDDGNKIYRIERKNKNHISQIYSENLNLFIIYENKNVEEINVLTQQTHLVLKIPNEVRVSEIKTIGEKSRVLVAYKEIFIYE